LLLDKDINCSTQMKVINEYTKNFEPSFEAEVLEINKNEPSEKFANAYIMKAEVFCNNAPLKRELKNTISA
jgi:sulfite reductase (ferredoxin)